MYSDLAETLKVIAWLLQHGGWVVFAALLLYMFYELYIEHIQIEWYNGLKWIFLKIAVPTDNEKSPLGFENIFEELHAVQETISWAEKHLEGQFQIWFTWEITSIGGAIGNYVRILPKFRDALESSIYSEFPAAEISEAEDYFQKLPPYDPDDSRYDIFAFSFRYINRNEYPIKTYKLFEHTSADTIVDPIAGLWEALGKISPYEMFMVQFMMRPIGNEWKEHGRKYVQKLKGVPEYQGEHESGIMGWANLFLTPIFDMILRPDVEGHTNSRKQEAPPSLMLHLSESEKTVISQIENKLSHWCYQTKIHCMYIAPKEKYNPTLTLRAVIGAFKAFGAAQSLGEGMYELNTLKPLLRRWTKVNYYIFKEWEKPITRFRVNWRKRKYFKFMKARWWFHGPAAQIMSSEELATLIHFPQMTVTAPNIERVEVTKERPPDDLPVVPGM